MTLSRRILLPLAAAVGVAAAALAVAIPALAGSSWTPQDVECQVDTKTITVKGDVKSTDHSVDDIYYNGRLVYRENVQTDDMGVGPGAYSIKVPYVQVGGLVRVVNEDSGQTIYWWGPQRYDPSGRQLAGRNRNSLGDEVDGHWQLEGDGPDQLEVRWNQTNGCHGRGVATRAVTSPADAVKGVLTAATATAAPSPCSADRAGPDLWPGRR